MFSTLNAVFKHKITEITSQHFQINYLNFHDSQAVNKEKNFVIL